MIDIIIPAYNSHDTIVKTLASIRLQTIYNLTKIYIIDDCSDHDYSKEIEYFKNELDITELKTPYNMGPGKSRQFALERTDGEYIVFMDADDQFYNAYVLNRMYYEINTNNYDMVYGDDFSERHMGVLTDNTGSLHGKIYRRSFLKKNKIKFNNTRYSEDDSFNKIVMYSSNKIAKISDIAYLYLNNEHSITNKLDKKSSILKNYIYNMIWVALELKRKKVSKDKIVSFLIKTFTYTYKEVIEGQDLNKFMVYSACHRFEEIFSEYEQYMNIDDIVNAIRMQISWQYDYSAEEILSRFNYFRGECKLTTNIKSVDVIVYAHNSHGKIMDSLFSLVTQTYPKFKVYVVNDNSAKDYKEEIDKVKNLIDIKEIKLKETMGRNAARQYAVDHSKSEYITFVEAGDILNDGLAIKKMVDTIEKVGDWVVGATSLNIEEPDYFRTVDGSLVYMYGKVYKRSFLKKHKIKFPLFNYNCDYAFNLLIENLGFINYSDSYTYIKRYDEFSGLQFKDYRQFKKVKDIAEYNYNVCWIIEELEKRDAEKFKLTLLIIRAIYRIYYYYIPFSNIDMGAKILNGLGKLKSLYFKYKDGLSEQEIIQIMNDEQLRAVSNINLSTYQKNAISFEEFLNRIVDTD